MRIPLNTALIAAGIVLAAAAPWLLNDYGISVLSYVALAALTTLGIVLLTGVTGLISFGQAAFAGIGAYTTGYLTVVCGLSPWLGLLGALLVAALAALLIGLVTLRMSGHYLALATLAWGISLYFLFGNLDMLGGYNGLSGVPAPAIAGHALDSGRAMYGLIALVLGAAVWAVGNLLDSRIGRAIRSIRHGVTLAESFGVDSARLKMVVFVIAAVLAAWSGWLYAHMQHFINPTPFGIQSGIEYLFMAVIGGAAHIGGALLGAGIVTLLKQWLQDVLPALLGRAGNFEIVVFGALMLLTLHNAKTGLWPLLAQARALLVAHLPARLASLVSPGPARRATPQPLAQRRTQPARGAALLEVSGARKNFGGLVAVNGMHFIVHAGEIVALLGPNGAGKSTMFNLVTGVLPASGGEIRFLGQRIDGRPARAIARLGIARSFQHVRIVPSMTLLENVALGAWLRSDSGVCASMLRLDRRREAAIFAEAAWQLQRVGLGARMHAPAASLALGQQRILEIARALAADPVLLMLDEPAAGLRHLEKQALGDLLARLRAEGLTVLLVEHDMEFVMKLADRLVVMEFGCKLADGPPAEVRRDPAVLNAYLGSEA